MTEANKPTILIVEDEPSILLILHRIVRAERPDYSVMMLSDAQSALNVQARIPVALVICDYNMTGMNGLELTRELHARNPALPVLLITAYGSPHVEREARKAGVNGYMTKPFAIDNLLRELERLLPPASHL